MFEVVERELENATRTWKVPNTHAGSIAFYKSMRGDDHRMTRNVGRREVESNREESVALLGCWRVAPRVGAKNEPASRLTVFVTSANKIHRLKERKIGNETNRSWLLAARRV